ncbi:MAG: sigma-70 family RNA polymerase sigma factor [Clostridiales bacterium]|nr:sigma-70 family RNA polymerase sigma factor [Clostridiales bacterium]
MEMVQGPDDIRKEALVNMVEEYQSMLLRMCYVQLRDIEMAKDAVQDTFLKAYRAFSSFRGDSTEKTWLIKIAMNTCRTMQRGSWLRHVDRRITPEDLPLASEHHDMEDMNLMCAVMALPPKWREIITLYYWQEMNVRDIAKLLGVAQSTVSSRLKRAREKLRANLEKEAEE